MYEVFLDGEEITGVLSVESGGEREIAKHDGLGIGKFPVPDGKDLRSWTIKTEQEGTALFGLLEEKLATKEASRLVIASDEEHTSELALLESYSKSESFAGVYSVTLKFVEYREAAVRTSDVPYIPRPGKAPTPPKTVVFNGNYTVYQDQKKRENAAALQNAKLTDIWGPYYNPATGRPYDNYCVLPEDKKLSMSMDPNEYWETKTAIMAKDAKEKAEKERKRQMAKDAIRKAREEAIKKEEAELAKRIEANRK